MIGKKISNGLSGFDYNLNKIDLSKLGGTFVIYFYPKDDTPGCTIEAKDFSDLLESFKKIGVDVYGVSKDSVKSHCKFRDKYSLNINLISDESLEISNFFGVWVEKSMMGKKYMGIERSTFVVKNGEIIKEYKKVSAIGHAKQVLDFCKTL